MFEFHGLKYTAAEDGQVNQRPNAVIPPDEPVFVLRARDVYAVGLLQEYLKWIGDARPDYTRAMEARVERFKALARANQGRMKIPD